MLYMKIIGRLGGLVMAVALVVGCGTATPVTTEEPAAAPTPMVEVDATPVTPEGPAAPVDEEPATETGEVMTELPTLGPTAVTTDSGLTYEDKVVGDGDEAQAGDLVSVHYTGWLEDGTMFDSSRERGQPLQFPVGMGNVIPGWDEGIEGMRVGGQRVLVIPADLGYGAAGAGGVIPPNATLIFETELVDVQAPPTAAVVDEYETTESGLQYAVLEEGSGEVAEAGDRVQVHYSGWLEDGMLFDSSLQRGQPIEFVVGAGNVIPGWDEGIQGMQVGERRQLRIPADLGYGVAGAGGVIPPNATLIFDVELVGIQ
jgi:peptidylprolyl isomerase